VIELKVASSMIWHEELTTKSVSWEQRATKKELLDVHNIVCLEDQFQTLFVNIYHSTRGCKKELSNKRILTIISMNKSYITHIKTKYKEVTESPSHCCGYIWTSGAVSKLIATLTRRKCVLSFSFP
jgi:hypothetical protein